MICSGCASLISKPPKVILLPEERIYTVNAGTKVDASLDGKQLVFTCPEDMKLVSSTVLVRQEEKLNNALLDKIKVNGENKKKLGIIGSIFAALAMGLGILFKIKSWKPNLKLEVK